MKKILGLAAVAALIVAAAPAYAQRGHGGGGSHGGGGFHGGGHGGGFHGGGYRGGFGYRGGYRYGGGGFYLGFPGYYPPDYYYGPSPYYGYPYPPVYGPPAYEPSYNDSEDVGAAPDRGESDWRVTRRDGETDFELPDSVLFALDSATISPDADAVLKEIADAARQQPRAHLIVEGHTDTSGTREHNHELSDARASAVATVLARAGVARTRITTEGLGEDGLAVKTADEVREPRNRRVVVRLIEAGHNTSRAEPRMEQQTEPQMAPETEDMPRSGNRP